MRCIAQTLQQERQECGIPRAGAVVDTVAQRARLTTKIRAHRTMLPLAVPLRALFPRHGKYR